MVAIVTGQLVAVYSSTTRFFFQLIEIQSDRDMLSCQLEIEKKNSKLQIKQIEDKLQVS